MSKTAPKIKNYLAPNIIVLSLRTPRLIIPTIYFQEFQTEGEFSIEENKMWGNLGSLSTRFKTHTNESENK